MLLKTSAVCLLMVIYMLVFYYRRPHIPVKSTRLFQALTGVTFLNTLFDLITVYTVNHRDAVSDRVNLAVHIIYLLTILGFVYLLFLYMRSYLEVSMEFSRARRICHQIPFAVSVLGILVLPITYVHGRTTDYSLGPKAYALYFSLVVYLLLVLYYCLRYWERLNGEKRLAFILAVPIYAAVSVIQMLLPESLIVVVASTLILLGLILSHENTEKYLDEQTALFNQYAFETVLEQMRPEKQKSCIAAFCFCKTENNFDWKQDVGILRDLRRGLRLHRLWGYRMGENGVAFIVGSRERAKMVLEDVRGMILEKYEEKNLILETKILPEDMQAKYERMRSLIEFCTETVYRFAFIDYLTHIYNRNAFERDLAGAVEGGTGCYIIADLNDLKVVNDTIGHSAGDELLQCFARLLVDAAGDGGKVYRQGGDEFAVLYNGDPARFVRELEERSRTCNQARSVPVSYAIGYCELRASDFLKVADKRMYEDKNRIKKQRKAAREIGADECGYTDISNRLGL